MSQRHLVIECAVCHSAMPIRYAIRVPRLDDRGAHTPDIAAYVCDRFRCFLRASQQTVLRPATPSSVRRTEAK